jgi:hypothetical protein
VQGTWRIIADLNPALEHDKETDLYVATFTKQIERAIQSQELFRQARVGAPNLECNLYCPLKDRGEEYFNIPVLGRTRGARSPLRQSISLRVSLGAVQFFIDHHDTGNMQAGKFHKVKIQSCDCCARC